MPGPLAGVKIVEMSAMGPAPFGVMLLADLGADVVRVDRVRQHGAPSQRGTSRNRRSIAIDLKSPQGVEVARGLIDSADVLVEGFRPGVMERLGLGPGVLQATNPALVYARMTGWGQEGPLSQKAGHDINYSAVAGALWPIGRAGQPPPPALNLIADFGGGGTYLAIGVMSALFERVTSGRGQVVDVAMVDGAASLTSYFYGLIADGEWSIARGNNRLDGAAPFYDTYATSDGQFLAVGASEEKFFNALITGIGEAIEDWPQNDRSRWKDQKRKLAEIFASRSRAHWLEIFDDIDACVTPVLSWAEASSYPHSVERGAFTDVFGLLQPSPAPRFSRTPGEVRTPAPLTGQHTVEVLRELGFGESDMTRLQREGVVHQL